MFIIGYIDSQSLIEGLCKTIVARDDSSIINIKCSHHDYSASAIAMAVEDADAHLVDMFSSPSDDEKIIVDVDLSKKGKIADVIVAVYEEEYYGNKYYYIEPILLFADGSKFAFDKYFTEKAFDNLLEEIQQLVNDFATL